MTNKQTTTECKECGGEGVIEHEAIPISSIMDYYKPVYCPSCKGTGKEQIPKPIYSKDNNKVISMNDKQESMEERFEQCFDTGLDDVFSGNYYCCSGRDCGCGGITNKETMLNFIKKEIALVVQQERERCYNLADKTALELWKNIENKVVIASKKEEDIAMVCEGILLTKNAILQAINQEL